MGRRFECGCTVGVAGVCPALPKMSRDSVPSGTGYVCCVYLAFLPYFFCLRFLAGLSSVSLSSESIDVFESGSVIMDVGSLSPCLAWYFRSRSALPCRFLCGSHVASSNRYPFQCTKYSSFPSFVSRDAKIVSTSYVLSSGDTAGSGSRRLPCMFTSVAGLIKLAWKIGWMLDVFGRLSLKLTGDVCSSISNGPYHFCRNFFVRRCLSHGNVMPSVDNQANFPTRNCSSTMRRLWLACVSIHESTARRRSRSSSSRIHIRSTKLFMFLVRLLFDASPRRGLVPSMGVVLFRRSMDCVPLMISTC